MKSIGREVVMQALRQHAPRAVHVAEVCRDIGVPKRARDEVRDVLSELVDLGMAKELPGGKFRPADTTEQRKPGFGRGPAAPSLPRAAPDGVHGRLTMHPRGFGFVATEDSGPDVFIPPDSVGGAMQHDYVAVQAHSTHKGREGRIVEVIGRGLSAVTGTVEKRGRSYFLDPDDARLRSPMPVQGRIPKDARSARVAVLAGFSRYPRYADELPEVEILEVLGEHGTLDVEVAKIKIRDGIVEEFSEDVEQAVEELPSRVSRREMRGREDLRDLDFVTIDPADARDHDDAVFAERTRDGGYRIIVAIADVSHYVAEGTELDREAFTRGCSIYLPDRAIPMLPAKLSTHLASLVDNEDRLCMAVEIRLGTSGRVQSHRFIEGVLRSRASLTYEGVAAALGLTEDLPAQPEAEARQDQLSTLLDASKVVRRRRTQRGSLDFDLPEAKVVLDDEDQPTDVVRSRKDPGIRRSYQIIEDMMILANEVVAADLEGRAMPTIYRVHGQPDEEKIEVFAKMAGALGYNITPDDAMEPKKLAKFLRKIEGTPHASVLNYLLLRAMQQATYDVTNIGHFGLGSKEYLHFTSPIRRYPDLVVHRVVRRVIHDEPLDPVQARPELRRAAAESSRLERRAMGVERDVVDLYRTALMEGRVGDEIDATIGHVTEWGFFSALDEPFVEVLTPVDQLAEDYFELDELGLRLVGRDTKEIFAVGDRVRMRIEDVRLERREVIATPVERLADGGIRAVISEEEGAADRRGRGKRSPRGRTRRQGATEGSGRKTAPETKSRDRGRKAADREDRGRGKGPSKRGGPTERTRRSRKAREGSPRDDHTPRRRSGRGRK
jgi:ribonuclease R